MTRRQRQLLLAAVAAGFAFACSSQLLAQPAPDDEGPIIIGQRRPYERFFLQSPEVALNLTGIYQNDKTTTGNSTTKSNQYVLEQTLELSTHGYVMSPNLFTLDISGSGGLSETWQDAKTDGVSASDNNTGSLYEWNVQGTFQPNGDTPLTLYSNREQGWTFRQFGPALQTTNTETGGALELRSRTLPTRFSASHLESEQTGVEDIDSFTYKRDGFNWHTTYLPSPNQTLNWDYNYASVEQSGAVNQSYQSNDAILTHEVTFGQNNQNSLTSTATYSQQSGDVEYERFRVDERLRFQHTYDFRTRYDYTYDHSENSGTTNDRHRATAGFTHDLYQSLTTNGEMGAQKSTYGDANSTEIFGFINWNYHKQVPLGRFSADLGLAWSQQDSEATTTPTQVIDQPAVFGDVQPIIITGTNVNANSIVITDPSGLLIYQPGLDYTVSSFPNHVEIDRVVGGRIPAGQAVLMDYILEPLPAATTTTTSFTAGVRYDFEQGPLKGLTLFTAYAHSNQNIDTADPSAFVPNDFTDIIYGVQYRIGNLTLDAEHQHHDSTINPFDADRAFARYTQRISPETTIAFNGAVTSIQYSDPTSQTDLFTVSGQVSRQFSERLSGNMTILYRYEDDSRNGITNGFEQQLELRWRHRQTQVFVMLRNALLNNPDQDQTFQFFQLGLRREF